jgi:hypothetical protein
MSTRRFVTGSSLVLAAWLGATFLHEVPAQRYPKPLEKTAGAKPTAADTEKSIATISRP